MELIAGVIEGDANFASKQDQNNFKSKINFDIHGTLKKTIFATSFNGLKNLIDLFKEDPDSYLSRVPQDFGLL